MRIMGKFMKVKCECGNEQVTSENAAAPAPEIVVEAPVKITGPVASTLVVAPFTQLPANVCVETSVTKETVPDMVNVPFTVIGPAAVFAPDELSVRWWYVPARIVCAPASP